MWTTENRAKYDRSGLRYPSDLTDAEWLLIAPLIPPAKRGGNKRTVDEREIVNGVMYILSTGCQWAALPTDLPPRSTVNDYFRRWDVSLGIGATGSHVPHESLVELRAAYMPDAARAGSRLPPSWSRRTGQPPVSTSSNLLSTLHRRFACARLSGPYLPKSCPGFSATLTTVALNGRSLQRFEACT